ncbi:MULTISPECIES: biosynthetic-type acetolactate synthase large subunit [Dethiosulfovibrio]|uniref:Acetolactate synthase n=2 Tax=Dethiosulfovibrio TaxID=47054 RepID=A0ABS9ENI5_9BACT|nr:MULTISPECIES: biosynthetic-type acetolactate synthase large subunit [Dethiosulfovibrio]MCF4114058.1 biosynthetic-type acetolactate synthase large subunit [Dethiosulfovibrio russensis]MCF4142752.1 biosynthetic-type acetolactate synthase large subunit [Dethiosulfovibrio marinus]MCF4144684.1 biosynthetic-type acetolactate synthase large subunit [Dethiosulfovibrio acidaminovorans]
MKSSFTGADILIKTLESCGIDVAFGVPGGTVIPLYDSLYGSSIKHVLFRHEQGACFAAAGYARASGKVGLCIATSGPGALNTLTALADSQADSVPIVVLTGQVAGKLKGSDAFQEADLYGASLSMVKHSFSVERVEELASTVRSAFRLASSGRPGPVLVDLPVDVQRQVVIDGEQQVVERTFPGESFDQDGASVVLSIMGLLDESKRPVILAGGGAILSGASDELFRFASSRSIPVATSLMGKGAFPEDHRLSLGMAGMHGTVRANRALSRSDLVLVLGCRLGDRTTARVSSFAKDASVVHVDLDRAEIGKNVPVDLAVLSDLKRGLEILNDQPPEHSFEEWASRWESLVSKEVSPDGVLSPEDIMDTVRERLSPEDVVTTDVGQHQMWGALFWKSLKPRTFLSSGGQGTMGFGLPAAIGASMAKPGRPVVCLSGDGSFLMNSQEMETAVRMELPVKIILFNNGSLGMVRQWQELFWDERYSATVETPVCDFVALARAYGAQGFRVFSRKDLDVCLDRAFGYPGPSLIECPISDDFKVFPMVTPGGGLEDMLVEG